MSTSSKKAPLLVGLAAILWSFDGFLRRSLYSLPPFIVVFFEHLIGLVLLTLVYPKWLVEVKQLTRKEWFAICIVALFSGMLGTVLYTAALGQVQYIQYSIVVLLQQLQPIFALIAARLVLKEKLHRSFLQYAVIAIAGAYLLTFKDLRVNVESSQATILAAAMAIGAAACWGSTTSLSKVVLNKVSSVTASGLRFLLTPLFALVAILLLNQHTQLFAIQPAQWQALGLITVSTGLVALLIYYKGIQNTSAKVSALFELLWPFSAVVIDVVILKNTFSITQVIGGILLLVALHKVRQLTKNEVVVTSNESSPAQH